MGNGASVASGAIEGVSDQIEHLMRSNAGAIRSWLETAEQEEVTSAVYPLSDKARSKLAGALDLARGYTRVQYVAYEICTMPHGFDTRYTGKDDWYVGKEDIPEDIRGRVALLREVLEKVAADPTIDHSPATMKIFMAPEFLFRGPKGAYALKHVLGTESCHAEAGESTIGSGQPVSENSLQAQLAQLTLSPKWRDWVFVFGTVVGYKQPSVDGAPAAPTAEPAPAGKSTADAVREGNYEIYNVSLVQCGGCASLEEAERRARCVIKSSRSGIDFLNHAQFGGLANGDVRSMLDPVDDLEGRTLALAGDADTLEIDDDGLFTMNGVSFGLEICLDHAKHRLVRAAAKSGAKVQVQLVPSGGMEIHEESICVEPGGLVFHCDGLKKGPKGTVSGFGAFSTALQVVDAKTRNALKPLAKYDPHADWKKALDGLFLTDVDAPSATLYPPVALPTLPSAP